MRYLLFLILGIIQINVVNCIGGISGFDFSPDSKKVCITIIKSREKNSTCRMYIINLEQKGKKEIPLPEEVKYVKSTAWSPKGDNTAFIYDIEKIGIYDVNRNKFKFFSRYFTFSYLAPVIKWHSTGRKILVNCATNYTIDRLLNCVIFEEDESELKIKKVYIIDCKVSRIGWGWSGDKVVYVNRGNDRVYVSDIEGKKKAVLMRKKDVKYLVVSPNGDRVVVAKPTYLEKKVYLLDGVRNFIEKGQKIKIKEAPIYWGDWFPDSKRMLTCESKKGIWSFFIYDFDTNKIEKIFSRKFDDEIVDYKLSPDGDKFLIVELTKEIVYIFEINQKKFERIF